MAIENFYTAPVAPKASEPAPAKPAAGAQGSTSSPGLDFLNLIFGTIQPKADAAALENATIPAADGNSKALSKDEILKKNFETKLQKILAANPEIAAQVQALPVNMQEQIAQTLALNQKAFDAVLKPLTDGAITTENIENGAPGLLNALLAAVEKQKALLLQKNASATDDVALDSTDKTDAAKKQDILLALLHHLQNLTPAQITEIQDKVADLQKKNPGLSTEDALLQINGLVPPVLTAADKKKDGLAQIALLAANPSTPVSHGTSGTGSTLKAAGSTQPGANPDPFHMGKGAAGDAENESSGITKAEKNPKIKTSLTDLGQSKGSAHRAANATVAASGAVNATATLAPFDFSENFYQQFNAHLNGQTITGPANFTSLVTQTASAQVPTPAMQMVSATILKAASEGEAKNITLRLDPPELGRVEVRLTFEKNKTVKAVLMAEKSDTYLMLQRDSHLLERALQDAGLDSNGGISFELADSGQQFNQDNQRGGGHERGGTGTGSSNDNDFMQSTMNWQVDPDTGHTRYNILA